MHVCVCVCCVVCMYACMYACIHVHIGVLLFGAIKNVVLVLTSKKYTKSSPHISAIEHATHYVLHTTHIGNPAPIYHQGAFYLTNQVHTTHSFPTHTRTIVASLLIVFISTHVHDSTNCSYTHKDTHRDAHTHTHRRTDTHIQTRT